MPNFFKLNEFYDYVDSLRNFTEIESKLNQFSQGKELWTFIKYPDITPQYLISNLGQCYNITTNLLLKKSYNSLKKIYSHQLKTNSINEPFNINRRVRIQKLVGFNFLETNNYIAENIENFEIVHYYNDLNSLELDLLYFVENVGKRKPFTLETILEIRRVYNQTAPTMRELVRRYNSNYKTMSKIVKNETWKVHSKT